MDYATTAMAVSYTNLFMRRWASLSLPLLVLASAPHVRAHEPPRGSGLFHQAGQQLLRTNRGLIVNPDGSDDYRLLCNDALGIDTYEVPSVVPRQDGTWLIGTAHGLLVASADLCDVSALPPLDTTPIGGLAQDPSDADHLYVATAYSDARNGLYESHDLGHSWSAYGDQTHAELMIRLQISQRDPARFYAAAKRTNPDGGGSIALLGDSSDRGLHFDFEEIPLGPFDYGVDLFGVAEGATTDVFGVLHAFLGTGMDDRLIASHEGGAWQVALSSITLDAFAERDADHTLWVGSTAGLWRSSDLAQHFTQLQTSPFYCLQSQADTLYACIGSGASGSLAASHDDGMTFQTLFSFAQVIGPVICPVSATASRLCQTAWTDWRREIPEQVSPDAGAADSGSSDDDGGATQQTIDASADGSAQTPAALDASSPTVVDASASSRGRTLDACVADGSTSDATRCDGETHSGNGTTDATAQGNMAPDTGLDAGTKTRNATRHAGQRRVQRSGCSCRAAGGSPRSLTLPLMAAVAFVALAAARGIHRRRGLRSTPASGPTSTLTGWRT